MDESIARSEFAIELRVLDGQVLRIHKADIGTSEFMLHQASNLNIVMRSTYCGAKYS